MRVQLALNVTDLEAAIAFYSRIFAVDVHKREPEYANFIVDQPPLKLVLFETAHTEPRLNHLGVEVFDEDDVAAQAERLAAAGLEATINEREVCCFAEQNKVVTHDPQGLMWEWYRITDDAPGLPRQAAESEPAGRNRDAARPVCCSGDSCA